MRRASAIVAIMLLACGREQRVESSATTTSHAAPGANVPGFAFLPPLAREPGPGVLEGGLAPVVTVEELPPGTRGVVATFTVGSGVKQSGALQDGHYAVIWHTKGSALVPGLGYRIRVSLEGLELGSIDVLAVEGGAGHCDVSSCGLFRLHVGRTLPIKFRIESAATRCVGVVCAPDDACHLAGTCDPATGECSSPVATDGTPCDDGNACTSGDACRVGACVGTPAPCCGPARFAATGSMATPRAFATATPLASGRVLVAGGAAPPSGYSTGSAEIFDPAAGGAGAFAATGSLSGPREFAAATLLADGTVLVAGGVVAAPSTFLPLASAERFDPDGGAVGLFSPTGSLSIGRDEATATRLPDGSVLVAGGVTGSGGATPLATAELYDPASGTFAPTGDMTRARHRAGAALLPDGRVLVVGGAFGAATAELYDPATGTFSPTGSMSTERQFPLIAPLRDGRVLVAGGMLASGRPIASAEIYDPASGTFAPTQDMTASRVMATATPLPDGTVLVTGGVMWGPSVTETAELFDPAANGGSGGFTRTASMADARQGHSAALLADGRVLVLGGRDPDAAYLPTAEIFCGTEP